LADEEFLAKRVSVDYRNLPLARAINDLEGKLGIRIAAPEALLRNQDHVTCVAKDQEAGRVLNRILRPRGLTVEALNDGSFSMAKLPEWDEFRVKPQPVFEFAQKPKVTREGDRVTIAFETRAFCDVAVAIEDASAKIVRHLAGGVLGENAPEPFQWNSKRQVLVWDGKNDKGEYVDDFGGLAVRVSLGLTPRFERTLYWSPYKRIAQMAPVMAATEEGVVVAEGDGLDSVRMYDHQGQYLRTLYPFPAHKLQEVKGLEWADIPDGRRVPMKNRWYGQTLLTSGDSALTKGPSGGMGRGMSGVGAWGDRVALVDHRLNRLTTAGTTWGEGLEGGVCGVFPGHKKVRVNDYQTAENYMIGPTSAAFSPDGKWIYLAGYSYRCGLYNYSVEGHVGYDTLHGVARMAADGRGGVETFLGSLKVRQGFGAKPGEFTNAASVDCDSKGRVYVADFMNDRIQVFSPEGTFLKALDVAKPAVVRVHRRTGEIYVFSWTVPSRALAERLQARAKVPPALSRFGPFDAPKLIQTYALPLFANLPWGGGQPDGLWTTGEIDSWTDPPTIWLGRECRNDAELANVHPGDGGQRTPWETAGIKLLREKDGRLEVIKDFGRQTLHDATRAKPPVNAIQRLAVNPVTGKLYVGEPDSGPTGKAFCSLLEIDPESGAMRTVELPFNPMEYAFDLDGHIYLRNTDMIARYAFPSLREVPWDYGTAREKLGGDGGIGGRITPVSGGLEMPAKWPVCYHQGGIGVSAKGHVVASCGYRFQGLGDANRQWALREVNKNDAGRGGGKGYQAPLFPGRASNSLTPCLHVWDRHGKLVFEDAVPGVAQVDGVEIDKDLNLYFMHSPRRVVGGKPYFNVASSTLMKTRPCAAKVLSTASAEIPLSDETRPKRPHDLNRVPEGDLWAEGAEWFYGGVGFSAFNAHNYCGCWFARFSLDYFARSIAPEPYHFAVAVVDANGNLITRIGRSGNVDDGVPLHAQGWLGQTAALPQRGQETAEKPVSSLRPLGGDEVALFHPCYVATHTDRRIFISDTGNGRIVSVKLGYHVEEKVGLRGTDKQVR
jgi:sugar lactone lactonase YvrE